MEQHHQGEKTVKDTYQDVLFDHRDGLGYRYSPSQSKYRRRMIIALRKLGYNGEALKKQICYINRAIRLRVAAAQSGY